MTGACVVAPYSGMAHEEAVTLLTLAQISKQTGTSVPYWRRQVRLRRIRVYRLGDLVRISQADLAAWLAERAQAPEAAE